MKQRWITLLVFLGIFLSYISLSPGAVAGMGYTSEEMDSGMSMLVAIGGWLYGMPVPPVKWSRHGPVPVVLDLPFLKIGNMTVSADFGLSFAPVIATAILVTLIFWWVRRWNSLLASLGITMIAAFGTLLWPYAYIGLETKQSLFVLLAGFLALGGTGGVTWARSIGLALAAGLAVSVKSTSLCLLPAILFVVWIYFRREWPKHRLKIGVVLCAVSLFILVSSYFRSMYWRVSGGEGATLSKLMVDPIQFVLQLVDELASGNKGLLIFAPVLIMTLLRLPAAFKESPAVVIFALLVLGGLAGAFGMLRGWSDEVWGPRYLESSVAPLIICLGASRPLATLRRRTVFFALGALGIAVSFLGAFFNYGSLHVASVQTHQNTLEYLQNDMVWNSVRFNARLFWLWIHPQDPAVWVPEHHWLYNFPPDWKGWTPINLRTFARPQSPLIRDWSMPKFDTYFKITVFYMFSLITGPLLLIGAFVLAARAGKRTS